MSDALDAIAMEAGREEAEQQAKIDEIENPPPLVDPAETWAQIPAMVGALLAIPMPELGAAYTPDACKAWGAAMHTLAEKYEWDAAETMGRFAPEIGVVVASLPLVLPTIAAVRQRRASGPEKALAAPSAEPIDMHDDGGANGGA